MSLYSVLLLNNEIISGLDSYFCDMAFLLNKIFIIYIHSLCKFTFSKCSLNLETILLIIHLQIEFHDNSELREM